MNGSGGTSGYAADWFEVTNTGHAAVNITLGLPIVRTSVAHGTAYDIAGKGVADATSLVAATQVAAQLACAR